MRDLDHLLLTAVCDILSPIAVVDSADAKIIHANQSMKEMLGEECVGRVFPEKLRDINGGQFGIGNAPSSSHEALPGNDGIMRQAEYYDDESENWYHILQRPINWLDGTRKIVFVLNEINALKRLQNDLSEAYAALALKSRELELIAITDRLTQLYNRHHLDKVIEQEFARSRRSHNPFSVLIADCDKFKSVNDTYGHQVGDLVLIEIARLLRTSVRATDTLGRWGGEEILAILPETTRPGAIQLAEKLRRAIAAHNFPVVGHMTASFGVATLRPAESIQDLVANADRALYRAKENGRNRVDAGE